MSNLIKKAIIIATRTDSTRLPGKIFLDIKGKPVLWWIVQNCLRSEIPVVLTTTNRECDDPIEFFGKEYKVPVIRRDGVCSDVLGRMVFATREIGFKHARDIIIRVTHDLMGLTAGTIKETVAKLKSVEYAYSCPEVGFPHGTGCEAFTYRALKTANLKATSDYDREHVTPYIQKNFTWAEWDAKNRGLVEMELNTLEDYSRIKQYYENHISF